VLRRGGTHKVPVQNLDVFSAVLDYLAIETAEPTLDGRSLRPVIEMQSIAGEEPVSSVIPCAYASQGVLRSVHDEQSKPIDDTEAGASRCLILRPEAPREATKAADSSSVCAPGATSNERESSWARGQGSTGFENCCEAQLKDISGRALRPTWGYPADLARAGSQRRASN